MASDNGLEHGESNGKMAHPQGGHAQDATADLTPDEFAVMVDASEKPPLAARPTVTRRRGTVPGATTPSATSSDTGMPIASIQAARQEIYTTKTVPAPLRPIFDRLPPEEIIFIIAHVEHAYQTGMASGAASAVEHGAGEQPCGHVAVMAMYNEVIHSLLKGVELLDGEDPNVSGCLKHADQAYKKLQSWEAGGRR
jgi:hypothetical protein